jgi:5-methylcytosine-specific restriction endonuclease McrA
MHTLVLDQGFTPIKVISWRRAMCLSFLDKVEILASYEREIRTITRSFQAPAVVRLLGAVRPGPQVVRFSRKNVYLRDNHRCQYCGIQYGDHELTLDHVVPRVSGGKTTWTNVVTACATCNRRKGGRTPEQAGLPLRSKPHRPKWTPATFAQRLPHHDVPEPWRAWLGAA